MKKKRTHKQKFVDLIEIIKQMRLIISNLPPNGESLGFAAIKEENGTLRNTVIYTWCDDNGMRTAHFDIKTGQYICEYIESKS